MGFNNIIPWDKPCCVKDSEYFIKISAYNGFKYIKDMTIMNSFSEFTQTFNIFTLPEFNKLSLLSKLTLCGNTSLSHNIEGLDVLNKLHTLVIDSYRYMTNISPIATMYNITDLSILDCFRIIDYSPLSSMINLNKLSLTCFNKDSLSSISSSISSLINIQYLTLICRELDNISVLRKLTKLVSFTCQTDKHLCICPIFRLTQLDELNISCGKLIGSLKQLDKYKNSENFSNRFFKDHIPYIVEKIYQH